MDVVKICEVVDGCEVRPKYGDDCDGDKMTEHTDYIRRADAINVIRDECWECNNMFNDDLYMKILALPSAEAVQETVPTVVRVTMSDGSQYYLEHERDAIQADAVQGKWIEKYNGNGWNDFWDYTCSNCGKKYERADAVLYHANYCPNCGARMKGGAE